MLSKISYLEGVKRRATSIVIANKLEEVLIFIEEYKKESTLIKSW